MDGTSRVCRGGTTPSRTVSSAPAWGDGAGSIGLGAQQGRRLIAPLRRTSRRPRRGRLPVAAPSPAMRGSAPATHPCTAACLGESLVRPHPSSRSRRLATAPAALLKGRRLPLDGGEPVPVHGSEDLALQSDSRWAYRASVAMSAPSINVLPVSWLRERANEARANLSVDDARAVDHPQPPSAGPWAFAREVGRVPGASRLRSARCFGAATGDAAERYVGDFGRA